jgi:hypothetical protein
MLKAIATNGTAIVAADGDVGVSLLPDGRYLVALVGSLLAMSDWQPYDGPPPEVPSAALAEMEALKQAATP